MIAVTAWYSQHISGRLCADAARGDWVGGMKGAVRPL